MVLLVVVVGAFYIKVANFSPFIPPAQPSDSEAEQSVFSLITGAGGSTYGWYGAAGRCVDRVLRVHRVRRRRHHSGGDQEAAARRATRHPGHAGDRDRPLRRGVGRAVRDGALHPARATAPTATPNLATAFKANGVTWAAEVIAIGALAGLTTVVMVLILGQTRVLFAMSRDGLLPRALAKTGSHGTPVRITVLVGVLIARGRVGVPRRQARGNGERRHPVRVRAGVRRRDRPASHPARPAAATSAPRGCRGLPIAAILACLWLMLNLTLLTWIRFVVWMLVGVVIYFVYGRSHSVVGRARQLPLRRDSTQSRKSRRSTTLASRHAAVVTKPSMCRQTKDAR